MQKTDLNAERKSMAKRLISLPVLSWALYDFANTIFSSNIQTIFFPFYLQEAVGTNEQLNQIASSFISFANAMASFLIVVFSPLYGVWIDRTKRKKLFLVPMTVLSVLFTFLMGIFADVSLSFTIFGIPFSLFLVIIFFVLAKFFYNSSLVFYDSMIADLGAKDEIPVISGFGVAVGYVGTLVGLSVYPFIEEGQYDEAFIPTACLFLMFSFPLFFFMKEQTNQSKKRSTSSFFSGYRDIWKTFQEARRYRSLFMFMLAYFFLNDAIATAIAMMAVYAKAIVGFTSGQFILLYLVSTVTSIIGSFLFGYISKWIGSKRAVNAVGFLLLIALFTGTFAFSEWMFWVAGGLFGVALGSMWVTTRTLIVELSPENKRGQFFGLFAFSGKVSAIAGPFLYGTITWFLADYGNLASRTAMGSLMILVAIGLVFHRYVEDEVLNDKPNVPI